MAIDLDYRPTSDKDLARCLSDPWWRICSGALYKIMVKSDDGEGSVIPFRPNRAQVRLLKRLWHRNIILKARQLGFTTLIAIVWLDHALFNADQRCGIIAQDREAAETIFRDKVKLAYDRLPASLKEAMPLARDSATELLFAHNNSSVRVATSMRSGTIHRLHVSEFGKICAKFPEKAKEVVKGSLPAVPIDGIAVIESTAEGKDGYFYAMTQRAKALAEKGIELSERDYRFHFYPWFEEPGYKIETGEVVISDADREYFELMERVAGIVLTESQKRWYVATRDSDFSGEDESMWQEYPSTPEEAFQVSTEGTYYAKQLAQARKDGRIGVVPYLPGVPVNTFWDIGSSDGTGIWLHQKQGLMHRFIGYIEGWGEPYEYYIQKLQAKQYVWGTHYLPHDAGHQRQQAKRVVSPMDMLKELSLGGKWELVPVVDELMTGINQTRTAFAEAWFDAVGCKEGIEHLEGYRKKWNEQLGAWSDQPVKNIHTEGADSFRQWAQIKDKVGSKAPPPEPEVEVVRSWMN